MILTPITNHAAVSAVFTDGNIRIEALAGGFLRFEEKGPEGFVDAPTFHIVRRELSTTGFTLVHNGDGSNVLKLGQVVIRVPGNPGSLSDLSISKMGRTIHITGKESNSVNYPNPNSVHFGWKFADSPRLIPPAWGIGPAPAGSPFEDTSGWDISNNAPDVYVYAGAEDQRSFLNGMNLITGSVPMPPLFILGFTDSRWYPYVQDEAVARVDAYRNRGVPIDTVVCDTDWRIGASVGYQPNPKDFPDMPKFFADMKAKHAHTMFNDHPEPQDSSAFSPKEIGYRWDGLSGLIKEGLDIWWYDRNWSKSLANPAPGLRHEVWGMKLYHDMTLLARPETRPWIMANVDGIDNGYLNRPSNVATHRYPMQWTGDTQSTFEFLQKAVNNATNEGVHSENAFINEDLGGHIGPPSDELYARYLEFGCFSPITRVHCTYMQDRAPWKYGAEDFGIVKSYVKLRYRLLPTIYSSAWNTHQTGLPIVRRLDLDYPNQNGSNRDDEYRFGNSSLVLAPVMEGTDGGTPFADKDFTQADGKAGVKAEYFDNQNLSGTPTFTRTDKNINFDWEYTPPKPGFPTEHYSVRWTGNLTIPKTDQPRLLRFFADDGARVYVNGKKVIDSWKDQRALLTSNFTLEPGKTYPIVVEFFQNGGQSTAQLEGRLARPMPQMRSLWVPPGTWMDLWSGHSFTGPKSIRVPAPLSQLPMLVKTGSFVLLGPDELYTAQKDWSHLTLEAYPATGADAGSSYNYQLYEDDGISNDYANGNFATTALTQSGTINHLQWTIGKIAGGFHPGFTARNYMIRVHVAKGKRISPVITVDGKRVAGKLIPGSSGAMILAGSGPANVDSVYEFATGPLALGAAHHISFRK